MGEQIQVTIGGNIRTYPKGIALLEVSKEYQKEFEHTILLAFMDNKLRELTKTIEKDCTIEFVTTLEDIGYKTYVRGLTLVMLKAIYQTLGKENVHKVTVDYSIGNGLYCGICSDVPLNETLLQQAKDRMKKLIERDVPIIKRSIGTEDAIDLFHQYKMYDKERLFKYRRVSKANIYNLEGFEDYYYGYMPASTGDLGVFDLMQYDEGLLLILPKKKNPKELAEFRPQKKLFATLKEANSWTKTMEIDTVAALNDAIVRGEINDLILIQEALQEKKIGEIAEQIKEAKDKKFVMIAGPSSSGKTTFSHRLSIQLRTHGLNPHPIAVDDYFVNRDDTPLDEHGNPNYESLYAIDLESFNKDMSDLLAGKTVDMPRFNFKTGFREYRGEQKTLGPNDILVIEGIHGLNDELSYSLPRESKFKIYISALTSLNIDEHNRIPTTDGRLLRRMVRDARTRGASGQKTISMWPSVRRGEEEYIFPFQEDADVMFNSALIYELAVLKQYAEPILFDVDRNSAEYIEAKRLLKFLDYFLGVSSDVVPPNSMIKEFIGGSCFKV